MGKRDRIKRSPSHSQTTLSLKELKEFVAITSEDAEGSAEKELDPTNKGILRRSSRCRGPPKDPYANEFVGDIWTKLRGSKVRSLDESIVVVATNVSNNIALVQSNDDEQEKNEGCHSPAAISSFEGGLLVEQFEPQHILEVLNDQSKENSSSLHFPDVDTLPKEPFESAVNEDGVQGSGGLVQTHFNGEDDADCGLHAPLGASDRILVCSHKVTNSVLGKKHSEAPKSFSKSVGSTDNSVSNGSQGGSLSSLFSLASPFLVENGSGPLQLPNEILAPRKGLFHSPDSRNANPCKVDSREAPTAPTAAPKKPFVQLFKNVHEGGDNQQVNSGNSFISSKPDFSISDFPLEFVPHGPRTDSLTLKVPKTLTEDGIKEWGTTLVGYFVGRGLPYSLVTSATGRFWDDNGLVDTLATDSGFFFFTFSCEEQRTKALEGGPWYIAGQPLILQPWKSGMKLDKQGVHSIPIWVNLYGLPLELWNPKGISYVASYIGKPLRVDKITASRRRISYARVCVEVSSDLDLIDKFAIEIEDDTRKTSLIDITVDYQWKPPRCAKCSSFGHDCSRVAYSVNVAQKEKPTWSKYPHNTSHYQGNGKAGVWQVVNKKEKAKNNVNSAPPTKPVGQGPSRDNCSRAIEGEPRFIENVVDSITVCPPLRLNGSSNVQISNSFNKLIPYVYDIGDSDLQKEDPGATPTEESHERDDTDKCEDDDGLETTFDSPISARQRKKEAKMLFSGSRPKGRHRP